ncbi:hypothetical protein Bbad01_03560 [Bacillus badius]|nr:hypothetical protein B0G66_103332 [Bacillus badius]GLY09140.1 hypothetical protein Bbad01_03560 [Bacillus badius]
MLGVTGNQETAKEGRALKTKSNVFPKGKVFWMLGYMAVLSVIAARGE